MEEALIEKPTMLCFAGIELISDQILDKTTILTFRQPQKKHGLGEQIYYSAENFVKETIKLLLAASGCSRRDDAPGHDGG